jgi:hypothetical protein
MSFVTLRTAALLTPGETNSVAALPAGSNARSRFWPPVEKQIAFGNRFVTCVTFCGKRVKMSLMNSVEANSHDREHSKGNKR